MSATIASPYLRAQVSDRGAELVRLQDEQGRDLLWDGDPAFWTGRSPLLFPIVGRVRNDRIQVDGSDYELPKHGFARGSQFELKESEASRCRFRLCSDEATLRQYPFPFQLDVSYKIDGTTLTVTASVTNSGSAAMPVSLGFHPAFRWPLPFGAPREAHAVRFEYEETAPIRRPVDGLISRKAEMSPVRDGILLLNDNLFETDALVFDQLESRSVVYGAPRGGSIRVDFPGMPHLGIWTKPGAGFICIEPWQGHADPEGFDGELSAKPGIVLVQPGGTRDFAMGITVRHVGI
ncbi:aldose 1-epimerase family protein [Microvirga terrae]|uniref:Aldose 1-epimerase family protein n=1 Tax=Microvirga terrae TaxID=2740529 RepID=A0ABY5RTC2_9HYPH|nr:MULTISPECIES: aldose 1-epimerase family protein [Microvirga]MBQ0824809.1 aldose 1-epimerase family protein [Microvirga sp. HBU67558]UVF20258.1 aldose 1-epimerase family protein [Microvirga terrae]